MPATTQTLEENNVATEGAQPSSSAFIQCHNPATGEFLDGFTWFENIGKGGLMEDIIDIPKVLLQKGKVGDTAADKLSLIFFEQTFFCEQIG